MRIYTRLCSTHYERYCANVKASMWIDSCSYQYSFENVSGEYSFNWISSFPSSFLSSSSSSRKSLERNIIQVGLINVPYIEYARIEWMDILCVHLDEMKDWMKIQLSLFHLTCRRYSRGASHIGHASDGLICIRRND